MTLRILEACQSNCKQKVHFPATLWHYIFRLPPHQSSIFLRFLPFFAPFQAATVEDGLETGRAAESHRKTYAREDYQERKRYSLPVYPAMLTIRLVTLLLPFATNQSPPSACIGHSSRECNKRILATSSDHGVITLICGNLRPHHAIRPRRSPVPVNYLNATS